MSFLGRIWRGISQRSDNPIWEKEDPETILVEAILETEEQLVELQRTVAGAIAAQRNIARQLDKDRAKAKQWHARPLSFTGWQRKISQRSTATTTTISKFSPKIANRDRQAKRDRQQTKTRLARPRN